MKRWITPFSGLCLTLLLSACTVYPMAKSEEVQIDSVTLAPALTFGVTGKPFCLHLSYSNDFKYVYSNHHVEAWATDTHCADKGERRAMDSLALSWRYDTYAQEDKQCPSAHTCIMAERRAVEGRYIKCASARARMGDQTAFITTDATSCR